MNFTFNPSFKRIPSIFKWNKNLVKQTNTLNSPLLNDDLAKIDEVNKSEEYTQNKNQPSSKMDDITLERRMTKEDIEKEAISQFDNWKDF